jgi:hypothetical protein
MSYTTADARRQILSSIAIATEELASALADLGEAYEHLDEQTAETLEVQLFRPVQLAYGRAKRAHGEFAERSELPGESFEPAPPGAPSHGVRGFIDEALEHVSRADGALATLQDSMLPIDAGDAQLRAGLEDVRKLIGPLPASARQLIRTLGR